MAAEPTEDEVAQGVVELWFDYSSPFAYLATERVRPLAARAGARVVLRPFLLGALFRAIGTPLVPIDVMSPPKAGYLRLELTRWAEYAGVPFVYSTHFPVRTVDALRLTLLAPIARREELVRAVMAATWARDLDPSQPTVLAACCVEAGVDPALVDSLASARTALLEETSRAQALGLPGAPCFRVGREVFWGQDRLLFVEKALDRQRASMSRT